MLLDIQHSTVQYGKLLSRIKRKNKSVAFVCVFFLFVWFDSLRPMQHFFSYVRTSTKQRLMYLAQGNKTGMLEPAKL